MKYTVIRDTREKKKHGWNFAPSATCEGTVVSKMDTGDYTLEGFEDKFIIERKASTSEFATNIYEKRFVAELARMDKIPHPFLVLEFSMEDMVNFPVGSGIPSYLWPKIKVTNKQLIKAFMEFQLNHSVKIILAGRDNGRNVAVSLFKRIIEKYGQKTDG